MVLVKDPSIIEVVIRAEGKYPIRDTMVSPNFAWIHKNILKRTPNMPFR